MSISVKEVVSKKDLKSFIKFPFNLYSDNKCWVPPLLFDEKNNLSKEKNPAFDFCEAKYWLAFDNGKPVGRVAGIINKRYNEKVGKNIARFGYIDFIDDESVSAKLLETVEAW